MLKEIRSKAQNDADAAKDHVLKVFGLGVVYVDETTVLKLPRTDAEAAVVAIKEIYEGIPVHVVQLESVFETESSLVHENGGDNFARLQLVEDTADPKSKLSKLFESVQDATGREDLLESLRMQAIQVVAQSQGYTKVVLALTATRVAARVVAATTKVSLSVLLQPYYWDDSTSLVHTVETLFVSLVSVSWRGILCPHEHEVNDSHMPFHVSKAMEFWLTFIGFDVTKY